MVFGRDKMDREELGLLVSQGEGYNLEFKEAFSDSVAKDMCAFANANGGKILLGVSDNRKIKGISITNRIKSQIHDMARKFDPKLGVGIEEFGNVLMQRMNLVEKVGSGIMRMRESMKEYRLKEPVIETDENWFTIIFERPDLQTQSYEKRVYGRVGEFREKTREKLGKSFSGL